MKQNDLQKLIIGPSDKGQAADGLYILLSKISAVFLGMVGLLPISGLRMVQICQMAWPIFFLIMKLTN